MDPVEKRFKEFQCGWAIFESASDDEVTDGFCPTYEGEEGVLENEWEGTSVGDEEMVDELVVPGTEEGGRCSIAEVNFMNI